MNSVRSTSLSKGSGLGIVGFDLEGNIVFVSNKLLQIFKMEDRQVSNVHDLFINHSDILDAAVDAVQGKLSQLEVKLAGKFYHIQMVEQSALVPNADLVAIFSDISFLKSREIELQRELTGLKELNKELEQFAYVTSHDLNEPLRMVSNFAQLLESEYAEALGEEAKSYLNFVVDGSQRVQYLINDLLSYNRACRASIVQQEIQIQDLVLLQAYKLKEHIDTKDAVINIESEEPIYADPKWLGDVVHHILKNAIVHNNNLPPKIDINIESDDKEFIISIKDNGIGIDMEKHQKTVFQILKKVDSRPDLQGSGIGLAICKKIISLHEGKIWFESELGKGATFFFTLPKNK